MHGFDILGVRITKSSKRELLSRLGADLKQRRQSAIFTPNSQMLLAASKDRELCKLLNSSELNIPDGVGVRLAARLRGARLESMSGIDIAEELLSVAASKGYRVFFLGAKRGVAEKAAENMRVRYPTLQICGVHHGYFDKNGAKNAAVLKKIRTAAPDILFVCFGFPAQEKWITKNLASLPSVKLAMGLGGSLDVWSGNIRRAPLLIQKAGLEWLWRTVLEPKRARIFLDIPRFLIKALTDK
jgi:N-acetylglucosaminyldiphosphoundecaprenol N-acetyl-beta-D-mannosaminyltransferase